MFTSDIRVGGRGVLINYVNIAFIHCKTHFGSRLPLQKSLTQKTNIKIKELSISTSTVLFCRWDDMKERQVYKHKKIKFLFLSPCEPSQVWLLFYFIYPPTVFCTPLSTIKQLYGDVISKWSSIPIQVCFTWIYRWISNCKHHRQE